MFIGVSSVTGLAIQLAIAKTVYHALDVENLMLLIAATQKALNG
jgi:hypothetical protein